MHRAALSVSALVFASLLAAPAVCAEEEVPGKEKEKEKESAAPAAPSGNLVKNGDFSSGKDSPDGWSKMDNLSTFWVEGGPGSDAKKPAGKCLKIDTDVYLKEWEEQRKSMESGKTGDPKTKTQTKGDKYDTVAGTRGVAVYSDEITVKPEAGYKLSISAKSSVQTTDLFFPKIFVKGFGDVHGEQREIYNMYLACRFTELNKWTIFEREFHPTKNTRGVTKMKVMIYAYWPPGVYHFADVKITELGAK